MTHLGHHLGHHQSTDGQSAWRIFAPQKHEVCVVFPSSGERIRLTRDALGYWCGACAALPAGTPYLIEVDGQRFPDPASRYQPSGVHGPSVVTATEPVLSPGWAGIEIADAIIYELHVGTFSPQGTLLAAGAQLGHLAELGVNVIELLPLAAFPGERNWGYDGTYQFALHHAYGSYVDLKAFIEAAHGLGMAVILDVVYNHFGPEGNYSGAFAAYTKAAATPWGEAINFDGEFSYGVRAFFLESARYWIEDIGFDGLRMDAVQMIRDNSPVHILREFTDLARQIGARLGRKVLMIAEHLHNNRFVTAAQGFHYDAQWNDDLNHAVYACLTPERHYHYANFGAFEDVVKALQRGFVLDGTRFDQRLRTLTGTDGRLTQPQEHVVHIQNHDQVGNRALGDRMIATYGEARALLGIATVMASPFVPMLFMGEEYGETAPFRFFEDFSDPHLIAAVRQGRMADFALAGGSPYEPHDHSTFESSKLQWGLRDSAQGQRILAFYKALIALKRCGDLGPRCFDHVTVSANAQTRLILVEAPRTLTVLNFSEHAQRWQAPATCERILASVTPDPASADEVPAYAAWVYRRG